MFVISVCSKNNSLMDLNDVFCQSQQKNSDLSRPAVATSRVVCKALDKLEMLDDHCLVIKQSVRCFKSTKRKARHREQRSQICPLGDEVILSWSAVKLVSS